MSREHRRPKTDRLDTEPQLRTFLDLLRGEKRHCSMMAIPMIEEEDARRPNRERNNLVTEQKRIANQIKAILTRFGIRTFRPRPRNLMGQSATFALRQIIEFDHFVGARHQGPVARRRVEDCF